MNKKLIATLIPALMVLAGCGGGAASSSVPEASSTPAEETSSKEQESPSSSSKQEIVIPKVTPTIYVTPFIDEDGDEVDDGLNDGVGLVIAGPVAGIPGNAGDDWGYARMTEVTEGDHAGSWSYTFPETEAGEAYIYTVYVADTAQPFGWATEHRTTNDEDNLHLTLLTVEGQSDYAVTLNFSSQPDPNANLETLKIIINAHDAEGADIHEEWLTLYAWTGLTGNSGVEFTWDETNLYYYYEVSNVPLGAVRIDPGFQTTESEWWNNKSDEGKAANDSIPFNVTAGMTELVTTFTWSTIPNEPTATYVDVDFTIILTEALSSGNSNIEIDPLWGKCTLTASTDGLTHTGTASLPEGEEWPFCVYHWGTNDERMCADASGTWFKITPVEGLEVTITGSFTTLVGTMTTSVNTGTAA